MPMKARYGMSFVSVKSDLSFTTAIFVLCICYHVTYDHDISRVYSMKLCQAICMPQTITITARAQSKLVRASSAIRYNIADKIGMTKIKSGFHSKLKKIPHTSSSWVSYGMTIGIILDKTDNVFDSLWSINSIWHHRIRSTLVWVMLVTCFMPNH